MSTATNECEKVRSRILNLETTLGEIIQDGVLKSHILSCERCQSEYAALCLVQASLSRQKDTPSDEDWKEFITRLESRFSV